MTNDERHGHVVPNPDGSKARCGGPPMCEWCNKELAALGLRLYGAEAEVPAPAPAAPKSEAPTWRRTERRKEDDIIIESSDPTAPLVFVRRRSGHGWDEARDFAVQLHGFLDGRLASDIGDLQARAHALAVEKGWWPSHDPRAVPIATVLEKLCLIHSEVSEAVEAARERDFAMHLGEGGKPEGLVVELADTVIRVLDLCGALGLDLEKAIEAKHAYNMTRPHRHGGKAA